MLHVDDERLFVWWIRGEVTKVKNLLWIIQKQTKKFQSKGFVRETEIEKERNYIHAHETKEHKKHDHYSSK